MTRRFVDHTAIHGATTANVNKGGKDTQPRTLFRASVLRRQIQPGLD